MRAIGRASGAISVVNGLLGAGGCAAAVDLPVEVTVRLVRSAPGEIPAHRFATGADTPLTRAVLRGALFAYAPLERYRADVEIRSEIPRACGLKSSSAVSVALLEAVARARGLDPGAGELADRAAAIARATGQSATGAFDDAYAAARGGLVVTAPGTSEIRAEGEFDPELVALLWIPGGTHEPSPALARRFAGSEAAGRAAIARAIAGDYAAAMERNTDEVERLLGYPYEPLRRRLRAAGAAAVGVSGLGPALAVLADPRREGPLAEILEAGPGRVRRVALRRRGAPVPPVRLPEPP